MLQRDLISESYHLGKALAGCETLTIIRVTQRGTLSYWGSQQTIPVIAK